MTKKKKLLVILGPTATGKTDVGLSMAKKFNGEIISCDSRQVYKKLDIGTGKLPTDNVTVERGEGYWKMDGVVVWMYDVVNIADSFSLYNYIKLVQEIEEGIFTREKLPIVVGGTGLYLKGLLKTLEYVNTPENEKVRLELSSLSLENLQKKLRILSPSYYSTLNNSELNNKRRLIRKIELLNMNPHIDTEYNSSLKSSSHYDSVLKIGLTLPRPLLYKRIDERLDKRIIQGLIEEGRLLIKEGVSYSRLRDLGLEYKYLAFFLEGKITEDQFRDQLKYKIHQYAKRQMTWFKKEDDVIWIDITQKNWFKKVENLVSDWYNVNN